MSLVRVARISDLTEAQVIASALEAADIPTLVQNGGFGQADFLMQTALGGFGIMVPQERAAEAAAFIRQHRDTNPEILAAFDEASDPEAAVEDADWGVGRARRRGTVMRWIVVGIFVGPLALIVLYALGRFFLGFFMALFGIGVGE
ncbi:MAG: hypothetical protein JWP35_2280 [Caulobacter sp.]|nr:hypothetical protein [Caulobacter sp.]